MRIPAEKNRKVVEASHGHIKQLTQRKLEFSIHRVRSAVDRSKITAGLDCLRCSRREESLRKDHYVVETHAREFFVLHHPIKGLLRFCLECFQICGIEFAPGMIATM